MTMPIEETRMQVYGGRDEVKDLGVRLQSLMPSAQRFTTSEAMAVAQIAIAHRLDPFNGEVWGIKGDDKWYGVMVGIKGLRKCATRQAKSEETVYWKEFVAVLPSKYGEPDTSVVFECILRDTATMQAYGTALRTLTDSGVPYKEAVEMIGPAPRVVGIGIASPNERSKMKINQRAKKRSEADALKQRFDVEFGEGVVTEGSKEAVELGDIVESSAVASDDDGEARYVTDDTAQAEPVEEQPKASKTPGANLQQMGFGPSPEEGRTAPSYKANGTKIVGIVAEVIGCEVSDAAKIILGKYKPSDMLTEQQARDFAQGTLISA